MEFPVFYMCLQKEFHKTSNRVKLNTTTIRKEGIIISRERGEH